MRDDLELARPADGPGGDSQMPDQQPEPQLPADEGGTIAQRTGHNLGNLGDDVADQGDVTHPTPNPDGPQL